MSGTDRPAGADGGSAPAPGSPRACLRVDVHLSGDDLRAALRADAAAGLTAEPKALPPKWFYDERGSQLFCDITRLPEYYPTRCEHAILTEYVDAVARLTGAGTIVELGSGSSEKTRLLLDAFRATGQLQRFVPFDVSEATLRQEAEALAEQYPDVAVHGVVGDFEHHLGTIPADGRRLIAFLGGTIGNLDPKGRAELLARLSAGMAPGDSLLLGTDLLKDVGRLVAAYDDRAGVTAEFNRNVLRVVNRELGADFVPDGFDHVARFNGDHEWIEMWLRSVDTQQVRVDALDLDVGFEAGEEMRTEISAKFRRSVVEAELGDADLELGRWWTDPGRDFAVSLAFKQ